MHSRFRVPAAALVAVAGAAVSAPSLGASAASTSAASSASSASVTSVASTALTAASEPAAPSSTQRRKPQRYTWARVAPRVQPNGVKTWYPTRAVGIDDFGRVAGNADGRQFGGENLPFVGTHSAARWLDVSGLRNTVYGPTGAKVGQVKTGAVADAISPAGEIVGDQLGIDPVFVSWPRSGPRKVIRTPDSYYGPRIGAVNSAGTVAGSLGNVKVTTLFYGRPDAIATVPSAKFGNFEATGISERGLAVGTLHRPNYMTRDRYPEGVLFTARGTQTVKANATTAIDVISPNGKRILGRVGPVDYQADGAPAWLSTTRSPVLLKEARDLESRDVSDSGVVVGVNRGHAAVWADGRLTDLNSRTARLPRGWVLTEAVGINKRGELAVNAQDPSGVSVALKLMPR